MKAILRSGFFALAIMVALALSACSSTPEIAAVKTQSGNASWYGPGFQGRKTASGERFNMNAYSCLLYTSPSPRD